MVVSKRCNMKPMRALTLAFALLITPAAFAQSEPAWRTWLRQGEKIVRVEGAKLQSRAMAEIKKVDVAERWNFLQQMWMIRGSLMIDPETILRCCGLDDDLISWVHRAMAQEKG